ncbi:MAG TPA: hypothetical protein VNO56_06030 [Gaiellaceae bacterium]|nr:hypothetical protein [Gaiellaceae bacterium]
MRDPGLDRHLWESEWELLEPLVRDDPDEALPELDRLLERMLLEEGYPLEEGELERTAEEGIDPDVLASFLAARDITRRTDRGLDVDPAEIGQAVGLYRALYEHLITRQADVG